MVEPKDRSDSNEPFYAPEGISWLVFRIGNRWGGWKTIVGLVAVAGLVTVLAAWVIWRLDWTQDFLYGCNGSLFAARASGAGQLAFVSDRDGTPEIYLINADGTGLKRLTANRGGNLEPAWSPDGKQIAFVSRRYGNADIYVMNADGSGQRRLTATLGDDSAPTWSPDGTRIAFQSSPDQLTARIFVMGADGSAPERLRGTLWDNWTPDWSPDGSRIVFSQGRAKSLELWIMNPNGADRRRVSRNASSEWAPVWSPDGQRIAFQSARSGEFQIYTMKADGTDVRRLTNNAGTDVEPAWSPDGTRLAFTYEGTKNREICLMNADGSGLTTITRSSGDDWAPAWRPDTSAVRVALAASAAPVATATLYPNPWRATSPPATFGNSLPATGASATPTLTPTLSILPTVTGTLPTSGNLALNQRTSTSRSEGARPARRAVDGNFGSDWGSGDFPPQWIQIDLGAPASVRQIRLYVTQNPSGYTEHRILVGASVEDLHEVHRLQALTHTGQMLLFIPEKPLEDVRFVRVLTTVSSSWVGWVEIEVIGDR
jgi:Tol biopolymer transport system component